MPRTTGGLGVCAAAESVQANRSGRARVIIMRRVISPRTVSFGDASRTDRRNVGTDRRVQYPLGDTCRAPKGDHPAGSRVFAWRGRLDVLGKNGSGWRARARRTVDARAVWRAVL